MYRECVLGFDCRRPATHWTDPKVYGESYLLNPDAKQVLGISHARWPSVTNLPGNNRTDSQYWTLPLPMGETMPMGFWIDMKKLKSYLQENASSYHGQFWLLAFTRVDTPQWKKKFKEKHQGTWPCVSKLETVSGSNNWTLLGYDVEGDIAFSGLGRGWTEEYQQPRKSLWGAKLNDNPCFPTRTTLLNMPHGT